MNSNYEASTKHGVVPVALPAETSDQWIVDIERN
jgi:hypothetical protein